MSDYLRSAFGYFNGNSNSNDYVGQVLEVNNVKLRVSRLLAEGGWALVYAVEDVATGKEYALKRLIAADEESNKSIIQEINTLTKLSGHPNVIQYLCAQRLDRDDRKGCEYSLVTELCPGGTLADLLRGTTVGSLNLAQICRVAYQATRAVHHMHSQQPQPIIHWDVKLENFLIGNDGLIKLCDFGSASTQQILPDPSWNAQKRATLEDQMSRYTTPMYRSPEMMDTWNNEPIGPPVDCWALGCIFYALVCLRHPFPEGNKLAIVNARYPPLPANPRLSCIHELIKGCLIASPVNRLTTSGLLERLAAIAESNNFDPREPPKIEFLMRAAPPPRPTPPAAPSLSTAAAAPPPPPPRPSPPVSAPPPRPAPIQTSGGGVGGGATNTAKPTATHSSGLFSSLKGGAGSIFRNIKDTSTKVMHTVQQSMARTELDASYLTSRILVMPYPADGIESAYRSNHVEDVRAYLQTRHPPPAKIQLYNLSRGRPNVTRLAGKHIDCMFAYASPDSNTPLLSALYQICQDIYRYLDADFNHIVVLYCTDGCHSSATIACALLLYAGALTTPEEATALFTTRRCQPPQLQPSELRCLNYTSMIKSGVHPHSKPLVLRSLVLQPVPLFTRAKDGCRPYVEIYSNGALVYSTKRPDYEDMRLYDMTEGKACLVLGDATVRGDVAIVVSHARQQLGRVIGIKIASLYLHTGYVPLAESTLTYEKDDLDDTPEIGANFRVILNVMMGEENPKISRIPAPWEIEDNPALQPDPLFASTLEMEETLDNFRSVPCNPTIPETRISEPVVEDTRREEEIPIRENLEDEQVRESDEFAEADLLNLGMPEAQNVPPAPAPSPSAAAAAAAPGLDIFSSASTNENDLLGGFANFSQKSTDRTASGTTNPGSSGLIFGNVQSSRNEPKNNNSSMNDLLFGNEQTAAKPSSNLLFDPLSDTTSGGSGGVNDLIGAWSQPSTTPSNEENFPRNSSVPNFAAPQKDPFANLAGSLGAGLNSSWNGTPRDSNTPQSASPAPSGTPIHSSPRMHKSNTTNDTIGATSGVGTTGNGDKTTNKCGDAFEDLLGSQGYNFFSSRKAEKDSPKTINQMRKVEAARTMDPDVLKVSEWTEGKKGNLRALLCTLHAVLWPEADRWQKYEMHQLVSAADVKKAYRKACLAVHPDKQAGTANENIAKLIFMELNNAWSAFENDASQQNLFT